MWVLCVFVFVNVCIYRRKPGKVKSKIPPGSVVIDEFYLFSVLISRIL